MKKYLLAALAASLSFLPFSAWADSRENLTTIRVTTQPEAIFESSQWGPRLTAVKLEVKNVGSYDAEDIRVAAILPNGERIDLRGPSSLAKNQNAAYSASGLYYIVTNTKKVQADVSCKNCR